MTDLTDDAPAELTTLDEGTLLDYITGQPVKDTPKEQVRQRIGRALFHEYAISVEDMRPDFRLKVDDKNKKVDIAIFTPGSDHTLENLRRIVVWEKEPTNGKKGAFRLRDHDQAKKEFELLHGAMAAAEHCKYGLWTNGLEFFFFEKRLTRFDVKFDPIGDWPMADESISLREVASFARLRKADPEMLRIAFRRCHNFIHGNEGMPKDAAFWQFLYLIFAKMHDEKRSRTEGATIPGANAPATALPDDNRTTFQRQLAELRENLRLIEERKSTFVQETDIPLQLLKDERRLRERIADLEARLASM